jgi:hypothetical protein
VVQTRYRVNASTWTTRSSTRLSIRFKVTSPWSLAGSVILAGLLQSALIWFLGFDSTETTSNWTRSKRGTALINADRSQKRVNAGVVVQEKKNIVQGKRRYMLIYVPSPSVV